MERQFVKMMNLICSIDKLNKILDIPKIALYGAGDATKHILKYTANRKIEIEEIYVSHSDNNPTEIMGVSVIPVCKCLESGIGNTRLLVCVTEKWRNEVKEIVSNYPFQDVFYISDTLIGKIKYLNADYDARTFETLEKMQENISWQANRLLRFVPKPCLEYMIVHIVDHCNLRCKGCDHFACIADENFIPYETVHRDIERLSEIFHGDYIISIAVMGGEPLLHPELKKILQDVRKYFPHTTIRLTTNGILLLKQDNEFWEICRDNDVTIVNTKYPISLDFEAMQRKAKEENVKFMFFEGSGGDYVKHSFKKIINMKGNSNPADSFSKCHISNYGNMLLDGKFYTCPFSALSYRIFNKKFGRDLRMTEDDYIDIYKTENKEEFFKFAARPKFYCRYCEGLSPEFPWSRSRQDISEWVEMERRNYQEEPNTCS